MSRNLSNQTVLLKEVALTFRSVPPFTKRTPHYALLDVHESSGFITEYAGDAPDVSSRVLFPLAMKTFTRLATS